MIENVTFRKSDNGSKRAYLCARSDAPEADIKNIVKAMCDEGWYIIHSMCDGKPALEVRGYLREQSVLDTLGSHQFIQGTPVIENDPEAKGSFVDKLRARTLQGTSAFVLAADLS